MMTYYRKDCVNNESSRLEVPSASHASVILIHSQLAIAEHSNLYAFIYVITLLHPVMKPEVVCFDPIPNG